MAVPKTRNAECGKFLRKFAENILRKKCGNKKLKTRKFFAENFCGKLRKFFNGKNAEIKNEKRGNFLRKIFAEMRKFF